MKQTKNPDKNSTFYALTGLSIQIAVALLLSVFSIFWDTMTFRHLMWHSLAPLGVWFYFLFKSLQIQKTAIAPDDFSHRNRTLKYAIELMDRYGATIAGFLVIISLLQSMSTIFFPAFTSTQNLSLTFPAHFKVILLFVFSFAGVMVSTFFIKLSEHVPWRIFRGGALYQFSLTVCFIVLLISSALEYFNVVSLVTYINSILISFNMILAGELLFTFSVSFFKPRSQNSNLRPLYLSYILEILLQPGKIGLITRLMLQNILGYDITTHSFVNHLKSFFLPLLLLSSLFLLLLSSVVIVRPGEEAILLRLGKANEHPLGPGLHLKPPYPIGITRKYDIHLIRQIHVGSHKPEMLGGSVFKEGVPLLWTTDHGVRNDELLIVASPKQLMHNALEGGGKVDLSNSKTPSVSLAGADVVIEYVIDNLTLFTTSNTFPEKMLFLLSESEVSRHLLAYDIDTLLSEGRIGMAQELKIKIQQKCLEKSTGIKIVNVSISAVHPPTEIADIFEENVSALQERETKIQQAHQSALRVQVETAGSVESFTELTNQINKEELNHKTDYTESERMILRCGGEISKIISEATGYRWSRENIESGKTEKFTEELNLYQTSQRVYRYERYLNVLEKALSIKRKVLISKRHKELLIDINSKNGQQPGNALRSLPPPF